MNILICDGWELFDEISDFEAIIPRLINLSNQAVPIFSFFMSEYNSSDPVNSMDDEEISVLPRRGKSTSIEFLIPFVGIDIGGTLAKLCFALKKNSRVDFEHIESLTSKN